MPLALVAPFFPALTREVLLLPSLTLEVLGIFACVLVWGTRIGVCVLRGVWNLLPSVAPGSVREREAELMSNKKNGTLGCSCRGFIDSGRLFEMAGRHFRDTFRRLQLKAG